MAFLFFTKTSSVKHESKVIIFHFTSYPYKMKLKMHNSAICVGIELEFSSKAHLYSLYHILSVLFLKTILKQNNVLREPLYGAQLLS